MDDEHQDFRNKLSRFTQQRPDFFDATSTFFCGCAPGRLDVMGGIADYSGSLVLELPIEKKTYVAIQPRKDKSLIIYSENGKRECSLALDDIAGSIDAAAEYFSNHPNKRWASYCFGALPALKESHNLHYNKGLSVYVSSGVPEGKGVSSSAALESAFMRALCFSRDLMIDGLDMALLCQKVENLVACAPCGIMDQATSLLGEPNALLPILCQPCSVQEPIPLPEHLGIWGLDSGIRHSIGGSDYGAVRTGAFMGYTIIAQEAGIKMNVNKEGLLVVDDSQWQGYLANIDPEDFEKTYTSCLPEKLLGREFLEKHLGITDSVSTVNPDQVYDVMHPTRHPIYEHDRTRQFLELLQTDPEEKELIKMGQLMLASHTSYSRCGLGCEGTDRLVELAMEAGPEKGVFGAKISGGGSGGTVVVLGLRKSESTIKALFSAYNDEKKTNREALINGFSGLSPLQSGYTFSVHTSC